MRTEEERKVSEASVDFTEPVCLGGRGFLHTSTDLVFIGDTLQQETVHHGKEGRGGE